MEQDSTFLTIFHMDFNHVSLREDYIRKWLERLADMGFNAILWEIEDKVQLDTCRPAMWPEAMTKAQFRSIIDASRKLGLQPIPLLQTVGHAEYILKQEPYHSMREQENRHDCYCTSNPVVRRFLKNLIQEYLDLFGEIQHFHLGGDEAYVFATCPKCKAETERTSRNQLYADHIMDIAQPIFARHVAPGIWCDMIFQYPEDIDCISRNLTIWDWNYWDGDTTPDTVHIWDQKQAVSADQVDEKRKQSLPEIIDTDGKLRSFYTTDVLLRLGYDVFLCSSTRSYGDTVFCGRHTVHSQNVVGAARKAIRAGLLGHCVTSWAIRIFNLELQEVWLAMAGQCNNTPNASYEEILRHVSKTFLGIESTSIFDAIEKIASEIPLTVSGPFSGVQWTGMKDSLPAPKGFVKKIFERWKNEGDGKVYVEKKRTLENAMAHILEGLSALHNISDEITTSQGKEYVRQWLTAADFQLRTAKLVRRAFDRFETGSTPDAQSRKETLELKHNLEAWMREWITPSSANLNASLIFDFLAEWFESPD